MAKYNDTKKQFDDMTNKMKNINFNILFKIRYKELKSYYKTMEIKFVEIQKALKETNYEKEKVKNNIKLLDIHIHTFEKKYKSKDAYILSLKGQRYIFYIF